MLEYIAEHKACQSHNDCQFEHVNCDGVTEDGCTGAVFFNRTADMAKFSQLRSALAACAEDNPDANVCFACGRGVSPAACEDGRCTNSRGTRDTPSP